MAIRSRPLTYIDLQRIREMRDERLELIDGELFVAPAPTPLHQRVSKRLNFLLAKAIDDSGLGEYFYAPLDVKLADGSIVQPDLVAIMAARFSIITNSAIEGVPDFVVEILSPSHDAYDRERKRDLYAHHGVPEYWLVDPRDRTITIYTDPRDGRYGRQTTTGETAHSFTIPNLHVDLTALFSPLQAR